MKHLINDDFKEEHVNAFPVLSSQEDINENFKAKEEYDQNNLKTNLEENERNFENKNSGTLKNLEGVNQNILIIEQENTNEMQSRDFINSFKQDLQLNKILEEDAFEDIETNKETEIKIEVQQNQNFSEKKDEFLEISNPEKSPLSHQILIKTEIENSFKEEEKYPVGEINKLNGQDLDNKVNPKYFMENQQLEKDFEKLNFQREDIPEIKNNNDENLSSKHLEDFLNYQKPLSDQKILLQEDVIIKVENPSKEEDDKKLIEQETPKKEINEEEKENIENEEDEDEFGEFNYNVIEIKDDQEIQNTKEEKRFDQTEEEFNNFQNPEKKLCDKEHDKHNDINFANFTQNEEIIPKPSDIQNFDINFAQITQKEEFDKITFQSDKKEIIEADKDLIKNQEKENEEEFEEFIEFNANDIDKKETINFNDKQQFHKEEEEKYHEFNCNNDIKDDFVQLPQEKIEEGKEDDLNDDFGEFNENINKEDENQKSTKDQENKASNQFFDLFKSANTQNEVNTLNFATNFSGNFSSNFSNINFFQQSQNQNIESQINAENDQNQIEFQKKENIDDLFGENEEKINLEEKNPIFDEEISQKQTDEDNYNDNLSIQKKKDFVRILINPI